MALVCKTTPLLEASTSWGVIVSRHTLELFMIDLIPITVISAVSLFVIKEIVEIFRKRKALKRKVSAIKSLLVEEIELNHWVWLQFSALVETIKDSPEGTQYCILSSKSGYERFEFLKPDGSGGGKSFPKVSEIYYQKVILDIAELDKEFYEKSIEYNKAIADLHHVRGNVYESIDEINKSHHFSQGFISYTEDELPDIYAKMNSLYFYCTGKKLEKHRMR